jgi:hypothetical protein
VGVSPHNLLDTCSTRQLLSMDADGPVKPVSRNTCTSRALQSLKQSHYPSYCCVVPADSLATLQEDPASRSCSLFFTVKPSQPPVMCDKVFSTFTLSQKELESLNPGMTCMPGQPVPRGSLMCVKGGSKACFLSCTDSDADGDATYQQQQQQLTTGRHLM